MDEDKEAINQFRENPRKSWIWLYLNPLIDDILKTKLKDSLVLKYRPEAWLQVLYKAYFLLKSHYWYNIYQDFISDPEGFPSLMNSLFRFVKFEVPLYIRIVSLLFRILIDRMGTPKYLKLPPLPINYVIEINFKWPGPYGPEFILEYIDKITNNASLELKNLFIEAMGDDIKQGRTMGLNQDILFPIPFCHVHDYSEFNHNYREKYSHVLRTRDETYTHQLQNENGSDDSISMVGTYPGFIHYLRKYEFRKFIIMLADFMKDIVNKYVIPSQMKEISEMCNLFQYFFKNASLEPTELDHEICGILETKLIMEGIPEPLFHKFVYDPENEKISLADPLKVNYLFAHSLDLFNKPFFKDRYGTIHFSILWLFDALMSKLEYLLRQTKIGNKRGIKTESYYVYLIKHYISNEYPNLGFNGPYKLILKNNAMSKASNAFSILKELKKNQAQYRFDFVELEVPQEIMARRNFVEFDIIFVIKDTLFVLEIKDDLFWDIRDLPYILIRWGHNINQKLNDEAKYLENDKIKQLLMMKGIKYRDIKTMVLSQKNLYHPEFTTFYDLVQEIVKVCEGKNIMMFNFGPPPPYPWKT